MAAETETESGKKKQSGAFSRLTFRNLSLKTSSSKDKKTKASSKEVLDANKNNINKRHSTAEVSAWEKQAPVTGIAIQSFSAILACDLSFNVGDHITILTRTSKQFDWWEGTLNGKTGIFPANYIRVLES